MSSQLPQGGSSTSSVPQLRRLCVKTSTRCFFGKCPIYLLVLITYFYGFLLYVIFSIFCQLLQGLTGNILRSPSFDHYDPSIYRGKEILHGIVPYTVHSTRDFLYGKVIRIFNSGDTYVFTELHRDDSH